MCMCLISKENWYTCKYISSSCSKYTYSTTTYFLSGLSECIICRCVLLLHDMVFNRGELHHF